MAKGIRRQLWLHIDLPAFSLEVVLRAMAVVTADSSSSEPFPPLIVIEGDGGQAEIVALEPRAAALGLHRGMKLKGAWGLAAGLTVCQRDTAGEEEAILQLALWAMQFSSFVVPTPPAGLSIEIGGSLGLFGGGEVLIERLKAGLKTLGFSARLAIAPTASGARLLASQPASSVTDTRDIPMVAKVLSRSALREALAELPIDCLAPAIPKTSLAALRKLGLIALADIARLPRAALNRRIQGVLEFLDRASGRQPDPQLAFVPPSHYEGTLSLPVPVKDVEALLFGLNRLVISLVGYLEARAIGATEMTVALHYDLGLRGADNRASVELVTIGLVAPSREPAHLMMLAREAIERTVLQAEIDALTLSVPDTGDLAPSSPDLFSSTSSDAKQSLAQLLERLSARLGTDAVHGLTLYPDHRPERAWSLGPVALEPQHARVADAPFDAIGSRPAWLLGSPVRLRVVNDLPVLGTPLVLERGPERIESGWWDGMDVSRDYYAASNASGERVWVFEDRREPGGWYLHGLFA